MKGWPSAVMKLNFSSLLSVLDKASIRHLFSKVSNAATAKCYTKILGFMVSI